MFSFAKIKRSDIVLICSLLLTYAVIFIYQWFLTGRFLWSVLGVAVLSMFLIYLTSKRAIQKIIGEYPHPKRSKLINRLTWSLVAILIIPLTIFVLDQLNRAELDYEYFFIFIIVPILCGLAVELTRIPNITNKTQSGLICVIKKLVLTTVLFFVFIPFFTITNKLHIDINSTPDFHIEALFRGFIAWSMVFCFYVGLFLFIFAVIDFILVIKDLSIEKPRKPRQTRQ